MASNIIVALAVLAGHAANGKCAVNDTSRAYHTLCTIVNIAKGEPAVPQDSESTAITQEIALLTALNLTVADENFYNQEFTEDPNNKITEANWVKNRTAWHAAKENLKNNKVEKHGLTITRPVASHTRKVAAEVINRTLEMALAKQGEFKTTEVDDIQAELHKAMYGKTGKLSTTAGETFGATGAAACGTPGSGPTAPGMSLASDLVCICGSNPGTNQANECLGAAGGANCIYGDQTTAKPCFLQLLTGCPQTQKLKLSAAAIHATISNFIANLKDNAGGSQAVNLILGAANSATCNGATNTGCVKSAASTKGTIPIPWMRHLEAAATKLAEYAEQKFKNMASLAEIRHLRNIAIQEYLKALKGDQPQLQKIAGDQAADPKKKEPDCNKHKSKDDCKDPCKWNESESDASKRCSLDTKKAAEQATAAGTGEQAKEGAASAGCSRHGTKAECDADRKDDKQNCAWRKGKEGETDEPEKEKCRNGSFLATKKFALMVSAAFAALLF